MQRFETPIALFVERRRAYTQIFQQERKKVRGVTLSSWTQFGDGSLPLKTYSPCKLLKGIGGPYWTIFATFSCRQRQKCSVSCNSCEKHSSPASRFDLGITNHLGSFPIRYQPLTATCCEVLSTNWPQVIDTCSAIPYTLYSTLVVSFGQRTARVRMTPAYVSLPCNQPFDCGTKCFGTGFERFYLLNTETVSVNKMSYRSSFSVVRSLI
jgi:hypothetical protein